MPSTCAYLKRRWNTFGDDQSTFACALSVVLDHEIVWQPYAIRLLRRTFCAERGSSVSGQWRKHNTMVELDFAVTNGQWLEELGGRTNRDCHDETDGMLAK